MTDLIQQALGLGAKIYASVSGGKDGQAMVRTLVRNGIPVEALIHCDLGRSEWPQSLGMCERQAQEYGLPFHILKRKDGLDLLAYMQRRMERLAESGKPFWPSARARYCTSDLKRLPSNQFFKETRHGLIISAEGIRAEESTARAKKSPLSIRPGITSSFYKGMTVEQALAAYQPGKRLVLNWYPIFNMLLPEVWATYGMSEGWLNTARQGFKAHRRVPGWWAFHPAYAMGNDRVSCMFCILGSLNDLKNGARENPGLLREMVAMEDTGNATFRDGFSLKQLV